MSIATPRNVSLIDTLSAGYRALHRRPWVLLLPAALSAYLWLGAPVALGPEGVDLRLALSELAWEFGGRQAGGEQWAQQLLTGDVRMALAWLNFLPVFAPRGAATSGEIELRGVLGVAAGVLLINLLALLLSSLYLTLLGEAVRGERRRPLASLRRAGEVARDIALYLLALAGLGLLMALPFLAISAIVIATLPGATLLVLLLWYVVIFWVYVYTGFAPEAISVGRAGPLRAIYGSVQTVRRDLPGTLGLLLLSFLIVNGLGVIWRQLSATPAGVALAILGSAYVGSGLAAARLEFYRERQARWGGARAQ